MSNQNSRPTSYDLIPYISNPFPQSHPDRLATIATLLGLDPPPIESCKVLELGCAGGGNLVPMAEQFPGSTFLGIDSSSVEIGQGLQLIEKLGVKNVRLECRDILEFPTNGEKYDYILCHGVYSWVPNEVQARILEICSRRLADRGVAYVSYNTFPGWHMRQMIREIMRFRAKSFELPEQQLAQSRGLLAFLTSAVQGEDSPYAVLLKRELENINKADDSYLHHEHLEDINSPVYFFEFVERAQKAGLQYLGEADYGSMAIGNFPESTQAMIQGVSRGIVEVEQYIDFLRNRAFRQTLLCRQDVTLDRANPHSRIMKLRVASSATPTEECTDLRSADKTVFKRNQSTLSTNNPQVRAAFIELRKAWPRDVPFPVLASISKSMVTGSPVAVDAGVLSPANERFAETIVRCFETAMVDLHMNRASFASEVSDAPQASLLARIQAGSSTRVTNLAHRTVFLDDLQRQVLLSLDGQCSRNELADRIADRIMRKELVVHLGDRPISSTNDAKAFMEEHLPSVLAHLRDNSLLIR